jgi:CheY-like chemotaxis protein
LPPETVWLDVDKTRLAQALSNLVNNAVKYTPKGGEIRLSVQKQSTDVLISVKDNGIGIPPEMLPHVFDMFTQVDRSLERSQGGLGIGLNIVKRLVELHGGNIEARSAGENQGSEFVIRLPLAAEPKPAPSATPDAASGGKTVTRHRVLVADDNQDSAASLGMMLRLLGQETRQVHDGLEAVKLAEEFLPELILLDIGMPKLNGYDACRRIREQSWGRNIAIVALTGWGQEEDVRRSREAGFTFHIVKPIELSALQKLLAGLPGAR